jgi:hypothetical protein
LRELIRRTVHGWARKCRRVKQVGQGAWKVHLGYTENNEKVNVKYRELLNIPDQGQGMIASKL